MNAGKDQNAAAAATAGLTGQGAPQSGQPYGPKLRVKQAAGRAGVAESTWTSYVSRGQAPKPDGHYDARSPWWWASTVDTFLASRAGQGFRSDLRDQGDDEPGHGTPRQPGPGDPPF